MTRAMLVLGAAVAIGAAVDTAQYKGTDGRLRVALVQQPFIPTGTSVGPATMANGGIREALEKMGVVVRVSEVGLSGDESTEYGGWKRLGFALGHLREAVQQNAKDGYFTVGLLGTCPSMPG